MNPEFEQCLKRDKIREFPRGKALLTKTLGIAQRDLERAEKTLEELKDIINIYLVDKLLGKIRDGRDDFLNKRVAIRCRDESSLIVKVCVYFYPASPFSLHSGQ